MKWNRRHVLDTDDWSRDEIETVLDQTRAMIEILQRPIRRAPPLRGRTVILFFAESSPRTRVSFELAAKALSANADPIGLAVRAASAGRDLRIRSRPCARRRGRGHRAAASARASGIGTPPISP